MKKIIYMLCFLFMMPTMAISFETHKPDRPGIFNLGQWSLNELKIKVIDLLTTVNPDNSSNEQVLRTHPWLTLKAIQLAEKTYNIDLFKVKSHIIYGSIEEDYDAEGTSINPDFSHLGLSEDADMVSDLKGSNSNRASNHFMNYDDDAKGLTDIVAVFNHTSALYWAKNAEANLCSYEKAVSAKAESDKWRYLGHVLHLLEDMASPAHVRNDAHVFASDENEQILAGYLLSKHNNIIDENLVLINRTLTPVQPDTSEIDNYFNDLSSYTRRNFFSDDTILQETSASLPQGMELPQAAITEEDDYYCYGKEEESGRKIKIAYKGLEYHSLSYSLKGLLMSHEQKIKKAACINEEVVKDTFSFAGKKAIEYAAGLIKMFYDQVNPVDTGTWSHLTDMPTPRSTPAVQIYNGKIHVIGGNNRFTMTNTHEVYDIAADTWSSAAPLPDTIYGAGSTIIGNKIYVVGGCNNGSPTGFKNTLYIYDIDSNSWSTGAIYPGGPKEYICAVALNGKLYASGGDGNNAGSVWIKNDLFEYNPETDTWTAKQSMPVPKSYHGMVAVNGKIYAIGGAENSATLSKSVFEYDINTDSWTEKAAMPNSRILFASTAKGNNIYIIGGTSAVNAATEKTVYIYNVDTDTWTSGEDTLSARLGAKSVLYGNDIYLMGGVSSWAWSGNWGSNISSVDVMKSKVLLYDDFNSENTTGYIYNYNSFVNWNIIDGTVDIVPGSSYGYNESGFVVDLDGSTWESGTMTTKEVFNLSPGVYTLEFVLAANRTYSNTVVVELGNVFSKTYTIPGNALWNVFTENIVVNSATTGALSFKNSGGDNQGAILDNVKLSYIK